MLTERKLTERELESREVVLRGLLQNKQNLVKKYGKDAEKVMYGIATKKAKTKVESMNKDKIKELIVKALTNEEAVTSVKDVIDPADYGLIGAGYLAGFDREHTLDLDQLETLGRKIVKQLYKGDFKAAKAKFVKEANDPSGADLEGDPDEKVMGENASQDDAVMELRNIIDDLEDKAEEAREIVRQYFPNELSRLDGYGVFNVAYSGNRYDVTLGKFVDRLEDGINEVNEDNNIELKGQEMVDYIMKRFNWSEEKTLNYLAANFGKNKQDDGPKEKDPRYIDYLRRSGRDEYADELERKLKEVGNINRKGEEIPDNDKEAFKKRPSVGLGALLKKEGSVIRKKLGKAPKAGKVTSKQKMKLPSGMVSYMDFTESIYEKLTKKNDVGDFVDDFKKSDAKQFKGKSAKKKKEMAVAAYLSKQND